MAKTLHPCSIRCLQKCEPEKEFDPSTMNLFIANTLEFDLPFIRDSFGGGQEFSLKPFHCHMTDN